MPAPSRSRSPGTVVGLTLGQDPWRQREHGEPDGDVDEEDPAPAECLGNHAPEYEPGRPPNGGDPRPGRDGALSRAPGREDIDDHGQRRRRGQRAAETLGRAEGQEGDGCRRDAAAERCRGEEREPR